MLEDAAGARQQLVERLISGLTAAASGSAVVLRGSLAAGRADVYSDIDLLWDVPDDLFAMCITRLPTFLAAIQPIAALRSDPDFQCSDRRRLFFVRFQALPLFWRLDLDVYARSLERDPAYDLDNLAARGTDWSWPESALANVVAAVKARLRSRDDHAWQLLQRACQRIGLAAPDAGLPETMSEVVQQCLDLDPRLTDFGSEVLALVRHGMTDANDREV